MSIYSELRFVEEEIYKCMKCGNCQEVCPIYQEMRQEVGVARGKISLIEMVITGETEMTAGLAERMSLCTTCMACNVKCPCGVRFDQIILAARAEGVRRKGLHPVKKVIFNTLKLQRFFNFGMQTGSIFQGLVFRRVAGSDYGARMRVNVGIGKEKVFPKLSAKPFRKTHPETVHPPGGSVSRDKSVEKVAFFTGCMINYFYEDMGQAVLDVLTHNGIQVVIPQDQGCCGIPASVNGDVKSAQALAARNLLAFEKSGADALIIACSSCGTAWKHSYERLMEESEGNLKQLAAKWAAKTYDINEFLVKVIDYDKENLGAIRKRVTYHDPCHLNRGQGISKEPRQILQSIPQLDLIEMKKPDRCCGMAGSFSIVHPDLSDQILDKKIADIASVPADIVATACPACRLQLYSGILNAGRRQKVVHVVQLLAESYALSKQNGE